MSRLDIQIKVSIGDVVVSDQNSLTTYPFSWIGSNETSVFGQITIPSIWDSDYIKKILQNDGIAIKIPYTPTYKNIVIYIVEDNGNFDLIKSIFGNLYYFPVYSTIYNSNEEQMKASGLFRINSDGNYILKIINSKAYIYSAAASDFNKVDANIQNKNCLLKCVPSNNYRYPSSGVGLIRFVQNNDTQNDLASTIKEQFASDGVTVENASYDSTTGELQLELNYEDL